jgi:hypothetical protein
MGCDCIAQKNDSNELDNIHVREIGKIKNI